MSTKSQTVNDLKELKNIITEIKRHAAELKLLRGARAEIEGRIMAYLDAEELPGVKYDNLVVLSKETKKHKPLKKREKEENAVHVLEELGVENPKEAYAHIMESQRGEEYMFASIQLKNGKI